MTSEHSSSTTDDRTPTMMVVSDESAMMIDVAMEATSLAPICSKDQVIESSQQMFTNLQDYIQSEIELTFDDYKLLETMNNVTVENYQEMNKVAGNIAQNVSEMNLNYEQLLPKLAVIDKLDKKVTKLEKFAYAIDAYSKRLEKQYKLLEKKINSPGTTDSS